jgi:hypothetical protein
MKNEQVELHVTNCRLRNAVSAQRGEKGAITCVTCGDNTGNTETPLIYSSVEPKALTVICFESCDHKIRQQKNTPEEPPEANIAFGG